jgi:hypothetical protein
MTPGMAAPVGSATVPVRLAAVEAKSGTVKKRAKRVRFMTASSKIYFTSLATDCQLEKA